MIRLNSFWFAPDFTATIVQVDRNKSVVGKISVFTHVQSAVERILVEKIRFKTGQVVLRGVCTRHLFTQACALKSCQVAEVIRMDKIIVKSTK